MPDQKGAKPGYAEKSFAKAKTGRLHLVTSKTGRDGSIPINQNARHARPVCCRANAIW